MLLTSHSFIQAVCQALAHSLWQGLILSVFAGITIFATRRSAASLRYNLLVCLAILFMITVGVTFVAALTGPVSLPDTMSKPLPWFSPFLEYPGYFLDEYAWQIVMLWMIVLVFNCVHLLSDFRQLHHLRRSGVLEPSRKWLHRILEMQQQLGINRPVKIIVSARIGIPAVAGFFKPVILLPVGLLSNLPAEQVEAILLHELAHIRRNDCLVNLLQRLLEMLFFFNPGVLWLSALLKEEREHCCDDLVVSITQNKRAYVEALISSGNYQLAENALVQGFGEKKRHLLDRTKRLIYNRNTTLNRMEKWVLSACLLLVVSIGFIFNDHPANSDSIAKNNVKTTENCSGNQIAKNILDYNKNIIKIGLSTKGEVIHPSVCLPEPVCLTALKERLPGIPELKEENEAESHPNPHIENRELPEKPIIYGPMEAPLYTTCTTTTITTTITTTTEETEPVKNDLTVCSIPQACK